MTKIFLSLLILVFTSVLQAEEEDRGRQFGVFGGFGVAKHYASLEVANRASQFEGFSPAIEAGMDMPFSKNFGMMLSAEYRQLDLTNKSDDTNFIEKAEGISTTAKLGFFVGKLGFGGGITDYQMTIRQVSTETGKTESKIKGQVSSQYINYNFAIQRRYRLTFEGQNNSGSLGDYQFSDVVGIMKFTFLFDLMD